MSDPTAHEVAEHLQHPERARARLGSRALAPFRSPGYRRLAVALVFSTFANGVWLVGLVWEVIRTGGGPTQLSVVTTASAVGVLLPALLAGVVADRVPQRTILIGVSTLEAVGMGAAAALSLIGATEVWQLAVIAFLLGMGMAFYWPAYTALVPALVPESDLQAINGFEGMVRPTIGQALGPGVAGLVVGAASPGSALLVASVSSVAGLAALLVVPRTPLRREITDQPGAHPVRTALADVREGLVYMRHTPWLLATLLFASLMLLVVMGPLEVLVPFLVKDRLGGGPADHALVLMAFGVGGAVGSIVMGAVPMPRRYLTVMNVMFGAASLPMITMGLATAVWQVVVSALVSGALFSASLVIWGTLLQRRVPAHLLGRVSSLDFFVSLSLMPVSMALAAPVSNLVGLTETFVIAGVLPIGVAVVATFWARLPEDEIAHPLD
ncbi:MFS transporter [Nocardioides taihuensis]|uniref:MFS transporter n=1 Tax=Nocardioides taihuensis TaxID=1835606 RepID=A0ABW0BHE1_9ACTN